MENFNVYHKIYGLEQYWIIHIAKALEIPLNQLNQR